MFFMMIAARSSNQNVKLYSVDSHGSRRSRWHCPLLFLLLESCYPSRDFMVLQEGVGAVPFTAALENSRKFLRLSNICNSWWDINLIFHHSCQNTVIYSWALCRSQKKDQIGIWNPKKLREKFIKPTVTIIRKDKQTKCVYEKKYLGKKCISKSLI